MVPQQIANPSITETTLWQIDDHEDLNAQMTDGDTLSSMGHGGSGGVHWGIMLLVGIFAFMLCACLGYRIYQRRLSGKKGQQQGQYDGLDELLFPDHSSFVSMGNGLDEPLYTDQSDDGLDEPLFV